MNNLLILTFPILPIGIALREGRETSFLLPAAVCAVACLSPKLRPDAVQADVATDFFMKLRRFRSSDMI
jgi:hypothetical protein